MTKFSRGLGEEAVLRISGLRKDSQMDVPESPEVPEVSQEPENAKVQALAEFLRVGPEEITESSWGSFETDEGEYIVLTEGEATEKAEEYIRDSVWAFNLDYLSNFFHFGMTPNIERALKKLQSDASEDANDLFFALIGDNWVDFVEDAITTDGRGHFLSQYDGQEYEVGDFYIYRQG